MGSKSSSSSSNATSVRDERIAAADQAVILNADEGGSVTLTDPGAMEAFRLAAEMGGKVADTAFWSIRDVVGGTANSAMEVVEKANARSIAAMLQQSGMSFDFAKDVVQRGWEFGGKVVDELGNVVDESYELVREDRETSAELIEASNKSLYDTAESAMSRVYSSTRSESENTAQAMTQMMTVAIIAVAVVLTVRGAK